MCGCTVDDFLKVRSLVKMLYNLKSKNVNAVFSK